MTNSFGAVGHAAATDRRGRRVGTLAELNSGQHFAFGIGQVGDGYQQRDDDCEDLNDDDDLEQA